MAKIVIKQYINIIMNNDEIERARTPDSRYFSQNYVRYILLFLLIIILFLYQVDVILIII